MLEDLLSRLVTLWRTSGAGLLWLLLRQCWSDWQRVLLIVQPRTVIAWHRLGFRLFWRWRSRARDGRPTADRKLIGLIGQMGSSNPTWGSKRIQAELAKLDIQVSDSTIRKYRPRSRRADQTWKTFLHTQAKDLIAVDFFVVPTATFRVLYVFLVLAHERRKVLHFNITDSPSAAWMAQQMTRSPKTFTLFPTGTAIAAAALAALLIQFAAPSAQATDGTWTANADGNWSDTAKWSGGTAADGDGFTAVSNIALDSGHDHLYAKQDLGGIVYQEVPQPGFPGNDRSRRSPTEESYRSGTILSSSGCLRVKVSPDKATVEYLKTASPAAAASISEDVPHRYTVFPR